MALTPVGIVIYRRQGYVLTSYGNGWAYRLRHEPSKASLWVQDDDAATFRRGFDSAMDASEDETKSDQFVRWWFEQYSPVMEADAE